MRELSLNTKLLSHFLGLSFPFWIYSCDHSWKHAEISKYIHLMKQKYTWRPWNVFFSKLKKLPKWSGWYSYLSYSSNIFRFKRNSYSLYLYIYRHRFGMFWIYTTFVWKTVFGLENRCWSPISVCNDPASDGSRNPSKARRWRWGNIYIYIFLYIIFTYLFSLRFDRLVFCAMHFAFCPKLCSKSVQRPLRAALWTAQCPSRFAGQGC